jgi:hypothetical protein
LKRFGHRSLALAALCLSFAACERGCARTWFNEHGVGSEGRQPPGSAPLDALDCPDGLARCNDGVVEGSRLAMIPQRCRGTPEQCSCPWERLVECERGCVVEGIEVVAERDRAAVQLCAPPPDAGALARPVRAPGECDEDQLYRCAGGAVVSCAERAVVGVCARGCSTEGASIGGDVDVSREAAFAILCSR